MLRRWLSKYHHERRVAELKRSDLKSEPIAWLKLYIQNVKTATYQKLTAPARSALSLTTYTPSVDTLVLRLELALRYIEVRAAFEKDLVTEQPSNKTLDAYMVTVNNIPLRPEEVLHVLLPPAEKLIGILDYMKAGSEAGEQYYRRKTTPLIDDLHALLELLSRSVD